MTVEHISLGTGDVAVRDTNDVLRETFELFEPIVVAGGGDIPETNLNLTCTVEGDVAIFDILKGNNIITTNICCFSASGREEALNMARYLTQRMPGPFKNFLSSMVQPQGNMFIISVPLGTMFASPEDLMIAGEIELYIYETIRQTS